MQLQNRNFPRCRQSQCQFSIAIVSLVAHTSDLKKIVIGIILIQQNILIPFDFHDSRESRRQTHRLKLRAPELLIRLDRVPR